MATTKTVYTAEATVTGGRAEGHGRTSDGVLDLELRKPVELGGPGEAANPEQLLAIGWAACFEGALSRIVAERELEPGELSIDAAVSLVKTGNGMGLAARLAVSLSELEARQAVEVVRAADRICPYSRATRGNIQVDLSANGVVVD